MSFTIYGLALYEGSREQTGSEDRMATAAGLLLALGLQSPIFASSIEEPLVPNQKKQSTPTCPEKWIDASFVEMGCLLFNSTTAYTWEKANYYCQSKHNATLLEITTEMELAFIQMEANVLADHEGARHWWTSGTDVGVEGVWMWATSYSPVGEFLWYNNYPSRASSSCLMLYHPYNFLGINSACTNTYYPICQRNR